MNQEKNMTIPKARMTTMDNAIALVLVGIGCLTLVLSIVQVF